VNFQVEVTKLIAELKGLREEVRQAELLSIRDRLTKLESVLGTLDIPALLVQIGVLQEQIAELRKWREEADRRRWQVLMLFAGSLLTLLVQIALLAVKK
jgi:hypothetical protein